MSVLKQPNGDDYPAAALKHLQDADALLKGWRYDGAAYLSGYVVECALKTLIQVESGRARHSHELTGLLDVMEVLAVQAKTRTGRLYVKLAATLRTADILREPAPGGEGAGRGWTPEMRYRGPEVASGDAEAWLRDARRAYGWIVGNLFLEGAI